MLLQKGPLENVLHRIQQAFPDMGIKSGKHWKTFNTFRKRIIPMTRSFSPLYFPGQTNWRISRPGLLAVTSTFMEPGKGYQMPWAVPHTCKLGDDNRKAWAL